MLAGKRPQDLETPADITKRFKLVDVGMLDLVQHHDRGLIRIPTRKRAAARMIAQIALAWPTAKIIVVACRVDEVNRLCKQLRKWWFPKGNSVYGQETTRPAAQSGNGRHAQLLAHRCDRY